MSHSGSCHLGHPLFVPASSNPCKVSWFLSTWEVHQQLKVNSGFTLSEFKPWPPHFLAVWPWAGYLPLYAAVSSFVNWEQEEHLPSRVTVGLNIKHLAQGLHTVGTQWVSAMIRITLRASHRAGHTQWVLSSYVLNGWTSRFWLLIRCMTLEDVDGQPSHQVTMWAFHQHRRPKPWNFVVPWGGKFAIQ